MVPVTLHDTALAKLLTGESFNSKALSNFGRGNVCYRFVEFFFFNLITHITTICDIHNIRYHLNFVLSLIQRIQIFFNIRFYLFDCKRIASLPTLTISNLNYDLTSFSDSSFIISNSGFSCLGLAPATPLSMEISAVSEAPRSPITADILPSSRTTESPTPIATMMVM